MRRKDVLSSPRLLELKKRRRRDLQNKILFVFLACISLFSLFVYLSRLSKLNIQNIEISGNKVIETDSIRQIVDENLAGRYMYFIPKTNFLVYPKNTIKNQLAQKFKRLKDISFDLSKERTLSISVLEREGKYIWCGEDLPDINTKPEDHACSFVDQTGYVFDTAPYFSGDVYLKFFGLKTGEYIKPNIFTKLISFKESVSTFGIKISNIFVKNDGDIEFYLSGSLVPPNAPKILLKSDFMLDKIVANLEAAVRTEPLMSDLKNKASSMLYIDLRFGNKVYFKFK